MLPLLSFKHQWMEFFLCFHSSQIHQALDGFPYVTFAVPLSSGCGVPHVTALSQKAADGVPSCHCSELSSVWGFPHVVTALF